MTYTLDYVEAIGYIGGVVLAVALLPQVIKSLKDRSTADFSYGWQIIYVVGLWLNFIYFVLIGAVAAWATIIFEMVFAHFLLFLKMYLDGCESRSRGDGKSKASKNDYPTDVESDDDELSGMESGGSTAANTPRTTSSMLQKSTKKFTVRDAFAFTKSPSISNLAPVTDAYRGFHYTIDIRFEGSMHPSYGQEVMAAMLAATKRNGVRSVGHMLEVFDGKVSPPGFASAVLLDESHMTTHCYSDEGMLAFDCFTCGSNPEGTRCITKDMVEFFKDTLGDGTKVEVGHMPRFPVKKAKQQADCTMTDTTPYLEESSESSLSV